MRTPTALNVIYSPNGAKSPDYILNGKKATRKRAGRKLQNFWKNGVEAVQVVVAVLNG